MKIIEKFAQKVDQNIINQINKIGKLGYYYIAKKVSSRVRGPFNSMYAAYRDIDALAELVKSKSSDRSHNRFEPYLGKVSVYVADQYAIRHITDDITTTTMLAPSLEPKFEGKLSPHKPITDHLNNFGQNNNRSILKMSNNKNIFSMVNFVKVAREEDADNIGYEGNTGIMPDEETYGVVNGEDPFAGQQGGLGFTQLEIEKIKNNATSRGVAANYIPVLLQAISFVNDKINNETISRQEAFIELNGYILKILEVQKSQNAPQTQAPAETPQPEAESIEEPLEEDVGPKRKKIREETGFTPQEMDEIELDAINRGINPDLLKTLTKIMNDINEEVKGEVTGVRKSKEEGKREIEGYVVELLKTQRVRPSIEEPTREEEINEEATEGIKTDEILGFTPAEIEQIENYSIEKGLDTELLPELDKIIDEVNEKINNSVITKQDGIEEINVRAKQLIDEQNKNKPVVEPKTEDEINDELSYQTEEYPQNEVPETDFVEEEPETDMRKVNLDDIEITQEDKDIYGKEEPEEEVDETTAGPILDNTEKKERITPEQAEENARKIVLSETPEDYNAEPVRKYPVAYEIGGRKMAKVNIFRVTPQAEKMLYNFGKENIMNNPMLDRAIGAAIKEIREHYPRIKDITSKDDIKGVMYKNILCALSVKEKKDIYSGKYEDKRVDYRLKLYVDAPELVPSHLDTEWQKIKDRFKQELAARQAKSIANGKEPQKVIYDVTQSDIIEKSGIAPELIANLNKLINNKDLRMLEPIYFEAAHLSAYELGHREAPKEGQLPGVKNENGEDQDLIGEEGEETSTKIREMSLEERPTFEANQKSYMADAKVISGFMDDVWQEIESSTKDPKKYADMERVKLNMELFKDQAKSLLTEDSGRYDSTQKKVFNDRGKIMFYKSPKKPPGKLTGPALAAWHEKQRKLEDDAKVFVKQPDDTLLEKTPLNDQMAGIVNDETFFKNYVDLLKLKAEISDAVLKSGINVNTPEGIDNVKQIIISKNPAIAEDPVFSAFLNDEQFIKMAASQSLFELIPEYQDAKEKYEKAPDKAGKALRESLKASWGNIGAEALVAVAKKEKQLEQQLANVQDEGERNKAVADFIRARQNFISVLGIHSTFLSEHKESKIKGKNRKLNAMGIPMLNRDMLQMIAGYKEIPPDTMAKLLSAKYKAALKVYNNMMYKLAKLEKIKLASVNVPNNLIEAIIRNAEAQIKVIMEN